MIELADKCECCGCGACEQICSSKCIRLEEDMEGFLYPKVEEEECISCNLCEQVCPVKIEKNSSESKRSFAYGGWHKNDDVRFDSSSGGAFTAIAEYIIKKGGIVYGCTLNENMEAVHIGVENEDDLVLLRGSKYVQSKMNNVYRDIKEHLKKERRVLFVGTPCQAAGLCSFLGKRDENLYIIDFICHGVPSSKLFHEYIADMERKYLKKVTGFRFRNKDYGWNQTGLQLGPRIDFVDGTFVRKYPAFLDCYMNAFLDDVCLRPSCYSCKFKDITKDYSDFTIADFWGVNKVSRALNDGKGTSLVLVHNDRADELLSEIGNWFQYEQVDIERVIRGNCSLIKSAKWNPNRERFYLELNKKGYRYVKYKYMLAVTWGFHKICNMMKIKFKI